MSIKHSSKPQKHTSTKDEDVVIVIQKDKDDKKVKSRKPKSIKTEKVDKLEKTNKVENVILDHNIIENTDNNVIEDDIIDVVDGGVLTNEDENIELLNLCSNFLEKINSLTNIISTLKNDYKILEKRLVKELKIAQKNSSKRKRKINLNRQPSGFVKPTKISDELALFLDKPLGTKMARTDVTRELTKYIRLHNLQDKDNGRIIHPDQKLSTLLKITDKNDELTYFNIQRYITIHFEKSVKPTTESSTNTL